MAAKRNNHSPRKVQGGNYVSEWFGHRVYPTVVSTKRSLGDQRLCRCPFLGQATLEETQCIKGPSSQGICTISSSSNGPRQDWLVCPYRALDPTLLQDATRRLFVLAPSASLLLIPAPMLAKAEVRHQLQDGIAAGGVGIVYFQDKLGGEISLAATRKSPEVAFDTTIVHIIGKRSHLTVGRYAILEIQTMDFHGSYKYAVNNLKDGLRLHGTSFPRVLQQNLGWLSDHIEGPNIANVFKRTFYQMMVKFQIGTHEECAGSLLALPASVWDSWQRHLGKPALSPRADGTYELRAAGRRWVGGRPPAWIYVFDVEVSSTESPNPIRVSKVIATDAESVAHFALKVAPDAAIAAGGSADMIRATILRRLTGWWPELTMSH